MKRAIVPAAIDAPSSVSVENQHSSKLSLDMMNGYEWIPFDMMNAFL
jgi:hypothetical protein